MSSPVPPLTWPEQLAQLEPLRSAQEVQQMAAAVWLGTEPGAWFELQVREVVEELKADQVLKQGEEAAPERWAFGP